MADAHGDGGRDHLLLGDEHLEVSVGIGLGELLGKGGVAHLAIQRHYGRPSAERLEGVAVGLSGGDLLPFLIGGERDDRWRIFDDGLAGLRLQPVDAQVPDAAQLLDRAFRHVRR